MYTLNEIVDVLAALAIIHGHTKHSAKNRAIALDFIEEMQDAVETDGDEDGTDIADCIAQSKKFIAKAKREVAQDKAAQ